MVPFVALLIKHVTDGWNWCATCARWDSRQPPVWQVKSVWLRWKRQCTLGMKSGLLVGIGMYSASQHIPNIKDKGTERGQFLLASSLTECPSLEVATIETDMFAVCRLCCERRLLCVCRLLEVLTTIADLDQAEIYLETVGDGNIGFYSKKAYFEVKERCVVVEPELKNTFNEDGGMTFMVRQPRPVQSAELRA